MKNIEDNLVKKRLQESATYIRDKILKKPILKQRVPTLPKGNVAVAEVYIGDVIFCTGTSSNKKTLIPIPNPKSKGGQFEPTPHPRTQRPTDMDAEYKILSAIADHLEKHYDLEVEGHLYLYTERSPCPSCEDVIEQFKHKFKNMNLKVFWDYLDAPKVKW
jgi:hypothetical protein